MIRLLLDAAPPPDAWHELAREGPFVLFAALILFAGSRKWWRFGHQYDDKVADCDRQLAAKDAELAAMRKECAEEVARVVRDKDDEIARITQRADRYEAYVAETVSKSKEVVQIVTQFALQQQQQERRG